ncbi:hypothetical protein NUW54_g5623 [Trametes sanguinea]|uniref:Uncharacterized protein n=1 Tax=Trametes sanguinea TaxID=158606 RepID=A0ACC1PX43_9APHY|nr:hypothetical protein NUW54_g5623 [Trametes sanguinea]
MMVRDKPSLVGFILTFAIGSAISGGAQSMNMLIAGRAVQGIGGGGCIAITEIVYADLVPLPERGKFQGITASVWALTCVIGPRVGDYNLGSSFRPSLIGRHSAGKLGHSYTAGSCPWRQCIPVFFQATQGASAIGTGVHLYPLCFTIPRFAIMTGLSVQIVDRYRPQNYLGWLARGVHWLAGSSRHRPRHHLDRHPLAVPDPSPSLSNSAHALAFVTFRRCLGQSWGIVVGGTILQNELLKNLSRAFEEQSPQGVQVAYAAIPSISGLKEPLRHEVRAVFARATRLIWQVMIGLSGAGLLSVLLMREEKLRQDMREEWGLQDKSTAARRASEELELKTTSSGNNLTTAQPALAV